MGTPFYTLLLTLPKPVDRSAQNRTLARMNRVVKFSANYKGPVYASL